MPDAGRTDRERLTKRRKPLRELFRCDDCGSDTRPESYSLLSAVWRVAVGSDAIDRLCIGCIEARLERRLTPDDFAEDSPLNDPDRDAMSERLRDRLRRR